jgi:cell division protein FtsB
MRCLKYLIPLLVTVIVYTSISLFSGAMGFSAYDRLLAERDKQEENMEVLKRINRKLEGDKDALLYDSDQIAAYARELGYGAEEERFVRIVGLPGSRKQHAAPGQIVLAAKPEFTSERIMRIVSFAAGIVVFICLFITDLLRKRPSTGKF